MRISKKAKGISKKKKIIVISILVVTGAVWAFSFYGPNIGEYRHGQLELGLSFTAKNFCSCLYVSQNSEEACRDYAALKQVSPKLTADHQGRRTKSTFLFFLSREAQFKGDEEGCVLVSHE